MIVIRPAGDRAERNREKGSGDRAPAGGIRRVRRILAFAGYRRRGGANLRRVNAPARAVRLLVCLFVCLLASAAALLALGGTAGAAPVAAGGSGIRSVIEVNGRDISTVRPSHPLVIDAKQGLVVHVMATNAGSKPVTVKTVRLDSHFVGLTFITYATRVDMVLPPGQSDQREFRLDVDDVGGQAYGLLPGRIALLSPNRSVLDQSSFPIRVQGSVTSIYGVFGLAVGGITVLLLLAAFLRLAAGRLPANRWSRAMRFCIPGLGVGLTLSFTASVLELLVPSPTKSLSAVVVGGIIGFVLGYLTPSPDVDDDVASEQERLALVGAGAPGVADWGSSSAFQEAPAASPFAGFGGFGTPAGPPAGPPMDEPHHISLGDRRVRPADAPPLEPADFTPAPGVVPQPLIEQSGPMPAPMPAPMTPPPAPFGAGDVVAPREPSAHESQEGPDPQQGSEAEAGAPSTVALPTQGRSAPGPAAPDLVDLTAVEDPASSVGYGSSATRETVVGPATPDESVGSAGDSTVTLPRKAHP